MAKPGYLNVKVSNELKTQIDKAAEEDDRSVVGEISHLLKLGLKAREKIKIYEKAAEEMDLLVAEPKCNYDKKENQA